MQNHNGGLTHQQICLVIPRQALLRRLLPLGCGRLIACRHAGGPACVACTGSLPAAFSEQLRAGARLFAARAGSCFTIPPVIKSLQAGCGHVVAGMPACQTCRPTVWNGTSGFVVRPVMPGVSRRLATCCGKGCFRGMACPEKVLHRWAAGRGRGLCPVA